MTYDLQDIGQVARKLLDQYPDHPVWCLYGEMGAGKTTLIKALCLELDVEDAMSSPSFAIVNEYRGGDLQPIYHFDFYRIRTSIEAIDIGTEEYFESGNYCFVEWPERIIDLLPDRYVEIRITLVGANQREINVIRHDRTDEVRHR